MWTFTDIQIHVALTELSAVFLCVNTTDVMHCATDMQTSALLRMHPQGIATS